MCKAIDKEMVIGAIQLERKEGGKSGLFLRSGI
jgi:molybdenum cofactor biosynthesis enzyme